MKLVFKIFILGGGIYFFYEWNERSKQELKTSDEKIQRIIASTEMKNTFSKIEKTTAANENIDTPKAIMTQEFVWEVTAELPENGDLKEKTIKLLNLLKTIDENNLSVDLFGQAEVVNLLTEYNKNPIAAEEYYNALLSNSEINSNSSLITNLLKLSHYMNFNKKNVIAYSEEIIASTSIDEHAITTDQREHKSQIVNYNEASKLIFSEIHNNKESTILFAKRVLENQKNPLLRHEIISQVEKYYPGVALDLKNEDRNSGAANIKDYLQREVEEKSL